MVASAHAAHQSEYYDDADFNYATWWQGREYEHQAEVMAIRRLLRERRFARAVDVGGGFGRLSVVLADYADHVTLVEPSLQQLELASSFLARYPAIDRRRMTATKMEFPAAGTDLVTMIRVMHHLPEPAAAFAEVSRILRPGGFAIIEAANAAHAVNRMRYLLRREQIPFSAVDIGSSGDIPYVNHHPDTVASQLEAAGLHIRNRLSVSNLRHRLVKKVLPGPVMLGVERAAQERLAGIGFGPSMFFLAQK